MTTSDRARISTPFLRGRLASNRRSSTFSGDNLHMDQQFVRSEWGMPATRHFPWNDNKVGDKSWRMYTPYKPIGFRGIDGEGREAELEIALRAPEACRSVGLQIQ